MIHKNHLLRAFLLGISLPLLLSGALQAADYVFPDTVGVSATRSLQDSLVGPADTIVVTVSLSNMEPDSLRNLYYADHLPVSFFDIFTEEVQINGVVLADTEYVYEVGLADEIYAAARPHRWVIEAPPDSLGDRPCSNILEPGTGSLQIVYTARCTTSGNHCLPTYTWAGQRTVVDGESGETFGYTDSVFVTVADVPLAVNDLKAVLSGNDMFLLWSPPPGPMTIDHYVIYRDTVPGFDSGGGDSIGVTADTFYVDPGIGAIGDPRLNCYYLVQAVDVLGKKSDDSNRAGEFDKDLPNSK